MSTKRFEIVEAVDVCLLCQKSVDEAGPWFMKPKGFYYGPVHRACRMPLLEMIDEVEEEYREGRIKARQWYENNKGVGF